jgi:hypothetical protein
MSGAVLVPIVRKEARALLPTFAATAIGVAICAWIGSSTSWIGWNSTFSIWGPTFRGLGIFAYGLGALALGAQSVGHEYSCRTLPLLLSQPVDRRRLLLIKLSVVASMLLVLGTIAWSLQPPHGSLPRGSEAWYLEVILVAAACALLVAPWLTVLCRSEMAGVVFSMSLPPLLLVAGDLLGLALYGFGNAGAVDAFKVTFFSTAVVILWAVGGIGTWLVFMRLEAIEGRGPEVRLAERFAGRATAAAPASGVVHPLWALTKKELHLQQLTFAVAAIYVVLWLAVVLLKRADNGPILQLTLLYVGALAMLMGSLASAEERQHGTLEWQLLLPIAAWKQWVLKLAVVLGLAVAFALVLMSLAGVNLLRQGPTRLPGIVWLVATVLLTSASLYVSSLSASGVRAMATSVPVVFLIFTAFNLVNDSVWRLTRMVFSSALLPLHKLPPGRWFAWATMNEYLVSVIAVGLAAMLVTFAFGNHRSVERTMARTWPQAAWLAAFLVIGIVASSALRAYYFAS